MKKIFLLIFFSQIIFFTIVPPFQIPDESGHYENVYWLSRGKYPYELLEKGKNYPRYVDELEKIYQSKFSFEKIKKNPLFSKTKTNFEKKINTNFRPINFQSYHPFLYYLLLTPAQFLANLLNLDLISRFYITRLFSAIFFWFLIFSVYQILKILKISQKDKTLFLLFYGLNPIILYYSIGINPDIGVAIFSTFLLYLTFKYQNQLNFKNIILLGFISGICYLNKTSGLFSLAFILFLVFNKEKKLINKFKKYLLFLSIFLITISPWIYLHLSRYQTMSTPSFYIAHERPIKPNGFFISLFLAILEFRHTIMHFSGFFGALNHIWPNKIYFIAYTIIISLSFVIGFIKNYKKYFILSIYLISNFIFFYLLAFHHKIKGFLWDIQARHFLLAFFPFYFFVFLGLKNFFRNKINLLIVFYAFLNFLTTIFILLIPNFYPKENFIVALNILYPNFGFIFAIALLFFIILSSKFLFKFLRR
jgi:hypothetical protein